MPSPPATASPTSSCTGCRSRRSASSASGSTTSCAPACCITSPIPRLGLRGLRDVLAPGGAVHADGVRPLRARRRVPCSRTTAAGSGVGTSPAELAELVATLRELPLGHPLEPAAARDAGLRRRRRARRRPLQPARPRLLRRPSCSSCSTAPGCGSVAGSARRRTCPTAARSARRRTRAPDRRAAARRAVRARRAVPRHDHPPHGDRVRRRRRGRRARSTSPTEAVGRWVPVAVPTAIAVEERLPPGAAAALINRAHIDTDLVLFVDRRQLEIFRSIDGRAHRRASSAPARPRSSSGSGGTTSSCSTPPRPGRTMSRRRPTTTSSSLAGGEFVDGLRRATTPRRRRPIASGSTRSPSTGTR